MSHPSLCVDFETFVNILFYFVQRYYIGFFCDLPDLLIYIVDPVIR